MSAAMDSREFFSPDALKLRVAGAILLLSFALISVAVYLEIYLSPGYLGAIAGFVLMAVLIFYFPVIFSTEAFYSVFPAVRPDMDTMTAGQYTVYFSAMFALACLYVYFVSCMAVYVWKRRTRR